MLKADGQGYLWSWNVVRRESLYGTLMGYTRAGKSGALWGGAGKSRHMRREGQEKSPENIQQE